jgi:ATP-binding cassette subfamily F protein 3
LAAPSCVAAFNRKCIDTVYGAAAVRLPEQIIKGKERFMLRLSNICKYFGETLLFDQVNLTFSETEKVAVIGPNGCGKSTLLKIMAGHLSADKGHIATHGDLSIGYLPQQMDDVGKLSVGDYLSAQWFAARTELEVLEEQMQVQTQLEWSSTFSDAYAEAFAKFENCGGYTREDELEEALSALGLRFIQLTRTINTLSGGEKTKVALARLLLTRADLVLLDEPTNNLDQAGMEWLERSLQQSKSACIIVSHDRKFLDRVTTRTLEIDPLSRRITSYSGNYSWYRKRKKQDEERQLRHFKEQQIRIKRLTEDIREVKNQALATEKSTQNDYLRSRSKKVAAKAKASQARLTRMIELEKIENPRTTERPPISLSGNFQYSSNLVEARDLTINGAQAPILSELNFVIVGSARIAITGNNGSGKSTLLKLVVNELPADAGELTCKPGLRLGYLAQDQEFPESENETVLDHFEFLVSLHHKTTASNTIPRSLTSDGEIRSLLHRFQFAKNDVFKSVNVLSRGERTKLILASFMASELDLLVMDEPTNHLDLETIECFEQALGAYRGALLVVSHDRYFLERISPDFIWHLDGKQIKQKWQFADSAG